MRLCEPRPPATGNIASPWHCRARHQLGCSCRQEMESHRLQGHPDPNLCNKKGQGFRGHKRDSCSTAHTGLDLLAFFTSHPSCQSPAARGHLCQPWGQQPASSAASTAETPCPGSPVHLSWSQLVCTACDHSWWQIPCSGPAGKGDVALRWLQTFQSSFPQQFQLKTP